MPGLRGITTTRSTSVDIIRELVAFVIFIMWSPGFALGAILSEFTDGTKLHKKINQWELPISILFAVAFWVIVYLFITEAL